MTSITGIKYRAKDGRTDFTFAFEQLPDTTWRVWIDRQPSYGLRSSSMATVHRLIAGGRYYICWSAPIRTLDEAKTVASQWANATVDYIATGTFPPPAPFTWTDRSVIRDRTNLPGQRLNSGPGIPPLFTPPSLRDRIRRNLG